MYSTPRVSSLGAFAPFAAFASLARLARFAPIAAFARFVAFATRITLFLALSLTVGTPLGHAAAAAAAAPAAPAARAARAAPAAPAARAVAVAPAARAARGAPAAGAAPRAAARPARPAQPARPARPAPPARPARPAQPARPARPAPPRRPQVLFTMPAGSDARAEPRPLFEAWGEAVTAEPRALSDLGLKGPVTPARIRYELARRRLQHWEVQLVVGTVEHALQKREPPELLATAQVTVTLARLDQRGKAPVSFQATGRFSVPASVASQREILAVRQAAVKAAAAVALGEALTRLFPGK